MTEILQFRRKTTLWEGVKAFFNNNFGRLIRRQDMLNYISLNIGHASPHTIDTYRNYLYRAGYLKRHGFGRYCLIRNIPQDLTIGQVINEAYGNGRKDNKAAYYTSDSIWTVYSAAPSIKKEEFIKEEEFKV
jgi:hypothetical protein